VGYSMNWRRGILRLWLVASLAWIFWTVWHHRLYCQIGIKLPSDAPWCGDQFADPWEAYTSIAVSALSFPILTLALWLIGEWIARGFKSDRSN